MKKKVNLDELLKDSKTNKKNSKKSKTKEKIEEKKSGVELKEKKAEKIKEKTQKDTEQVEKKIEIKSVKPVSGKPEEQDEIELREFVSFRLGNEEYGIDSDFVKQIIKYRKPLDMGIKSEIFFGILNTKEGILPLVDFRKKFKIDDVKKDGSIIILEFDSFRVGIYVDYLIGIIRLKNNEIKNIPSFLPEYQMNYIVGVGIKKDNKIVIILDHNRLFGNKELIELKSIPEKFK